MGRVQINKGELDRFLKAAVSSSGSAKRDILEAVSKDAYDIADDLGDKCAKCITDALYENALPNMAAAVGAATYSPPIRISDQKYLITIDIDETSRPSLVPGESIQDMAALVDKGYDSVRHRVRGIWHEKETLNMPTLRGAHFVQAGVDNFNGNYSNAVGGVTARAEVDSSRF